MSDEGNPLSEPLQEVPSRMRGRNSKPAPAPKKRERRSYASEAEDARADLAALRARVATALRLLRKVGMDEPSSNALLAVAIEELEAGTAEE